ncbi:MAG: acylneuraminate cytidylyltransferase family protein [Desulfarculales bacterium]|jgi:N-acylneuraminate cytidylyltransferase|nr:acylneuraminate cytidylyltransferase family protein [Desulfarculales bacterium]
MNVAFIPVRGGSKSIPLKNIKLFAGKPLVYWVIKAAARCPLIERVYVSTDSSRIKSVVDSFAFAKVTVIGRSEQSAADTAATESAMLEFARQYDFTNLALVQATSPLLTAQDLSRGFEALSISDSVLSVVRQKRFLWKQEDYASPLNYDYYNRPRRQDFDGFLVENGAFYITGRDALLRTECRLSGRIKTIEMPGETYIEIDEPLDWLLGEKLLKQRLSQAIK